MASKVIVAFRDYDNDRQQTSVDVTDASTTLQRQNLADGLQIWSIGANDGYVEAIEQEPSAGIAATSPVAQGSTQLILEMKDSVTGKIYKERLPMPDLTKAADVSSNAAWMTTGQGADSLTVANPLHADYVTLQSAIDAAWQSPAGNTGTLQRAYVEE